MMATEGEARSLQRSDRALSALPVHLRDSATVYVFERGGYTEAKAGTNNFSCLVRRSGAVPGTYFDSDMPICYDREGSETLLVASLEETRLLETGMKAEEVVTKHQKLWFEPSRCNRRHGPSIGWQIDEPV